MKGKTQSLGPMHTPNAKSAANSLPDWVSTHLVSSVLQPRHLPVHVQRWRSGADDATKFAVSPSTIGFRRHFFPGVHRGCTPNAPVVCSGVKNRRPDWVSTRIFPPFLNRGKNSRRSPSIITTIGALRTDLWKRCIRCIAEGAFQAPGQGECASYNRVEAGRAGARRHLQSIAPIHHHQPAWMKERLRARERLQHRRAPSARGRDASPFRGEKPAGPSGVLQEERGSRHRFASFCINNFPPGGKEVMMKKPDVVLLMSDEAVRERANASCPGMSPEEVDAIYLGIAGAVIGALLDDELPARIVANLPSLGRPDGLHAIRSAIADVLEVMGASARLH